MMMKQIRMLILMSFASLILSYYLTVCAFADPGGNPDETASGLTLEEGSEDVGETPEESVSADEAGISLVLETAGREDDRVLIFVKAEGAGDGISMIQAENIKAGIRKTLYKGEEEEGEDRVELTFPVTANGEYAVYVYDKEGLGRKGNILVSGIEKPDISRYLAEASENLKENEAREAQYREEVPAYQSSQLVILGGGPEGRSGASSSKDESYRVKSAGEGGVAEKSAEEKYRGWSMLKPRKQGAESRAWFEPDYDITPQPLENVLNLSDYDVGLFKRELLSDVKADMKEGSTDSADPSSGTYLKSVSGDDNIERMDDNYRMIVIGIIVFVLILIMLGVALFLLFSSKKNKKKKKRKIRIKIKKRPVVENAEVKTSAVKKAAAKKKQKPALKAFDDSLADIGIEKYAKMTNEYAKSKHDIDLERVGLKKYYSERHGFECVDYTYRLPAGVSYAEYKGHLNDVDTALSNVSGVDTISFAVDGAEGTFRTTFYLNK